MVYCFSSFKLSSTLCIISTKMLLHQYICMLYKHDSLFKFHFINFITSSLTVWPVCSLNQCDERTIHILHNAAHCLQQMSSANNEFKLRVSHCFNSLDLPVKLKSQPNALKLNKINFYMSFSKTLVSAMKDPAQILMSSDTCVEPKK